MIRSHTKIILPLIVLTGLLAWAGCSQDKSPAAPPSLLQIGWQTSLSNLVLGSEIHLPVRVSITGVSPGQVDSVRARIFNGASQTIAQFHLYDDGSAFDQSDNLAFCDARSGDNVPHDGHYSRLVNSLFTSQAGSFHIVVTAWAGGDSATTSTEPLAVSPTLPPQLSNLVLPDSLLSGFTPLEVSIHVTDPNPPGSDSIASVHLKLYSPGGSLLVDSLLSSLGNGQFGTILAANLATGRFTGNYAFACRASNNFNQTSDSLGKTVFLQNLAPLLTDPGHPDTVQLPQPGFVLPVLLSIRAWDEQTNADIDSVYLFSVKPNGVPANGGNPIIMLDNGLHPFNPSLPGYLGDMAAGDSMFSTTAVLFDTSMTGVYHFSYRSRDKAGNLSDLLLDSLTVTP